jgi:hypothetical protein
MRAEIFHAVDDLNGVAFDVAKRDFVYASIYAKSITGLCGRIWKMLAGTQFPEFHVRDSRSFSTFK